MDNKGKAFTRSLALNGEKGDLETKKETKRGPKSTKSSPRGPGWRLIEQLGPHENLNASTVEVYGTYPGAYLTMAAAKRFSSRRSLPIECTVDPHLVLQSYPKFNFIADFNLVIQF